MSIKEKKKRLLVAGAIIVAFLCLVGWVVWSLYAADTGLYKPEAIPYEEIDFTTTDYKAMEFALNGQVLTFPVTVAEVEAAGYKLDEVYRSEVLPATSGITYTTILCSATSDSGHKIKYIAYNLTEESLNVLDCGIETIYAKDESFILCNGISISSSYEEVIATMGEPTEYEEDYNSKTLTYKIDDNYSIYIKYLYGNFETMETLMIMDI